MQFDLYFLRYSILLDGILTSLVAYSTQGWHLFLAASVLPFASGTGSAAKGVTLDLVEPEQRGDALNAIALIEKLGQSVCHHKEQGCEADSLSSGIDDWIVWLHLCYLVGSGRADLGICRERGE